MTTLVLALVLAQTPSVPCALPVYLTDGTTRCATAPASFAFGRVVWVDRELGRSVTAPASKVDIAQTQPIHEAARNRALKAGSTGRAISTVGEVGGEAPPAPQAAPGSASTPQDRAPRTDREKRDAALELEAARVAYARAVVAYSGCPAQATTVAEAKLRQQQVERIRAAAERLRRAEEAAKRR